MSSLIFSLVPGLLAGLGLGIGLITGLAQSRSTAAEKGDRTVNEKVAAGLSLAEFQELQPILDVKNQPWTAIPWKYSITEARKLAVTRKPIFMVVNTGAVGGCERGRAAGVTGIRHGGEHGAGPVGWVEGTGGAAEEVRPC